MTVFLRISDSNSKQQNLLDKVRCFRIGSRSQGVYNIDVETFRSLPGAAFSYWAGPRLLHANISHVGFEPNFGYVRVGVQTDDDTRFVRLWWEISKISTKERSHEEKKGNWVPFIKGDASSRFFFNSVTVIDWRDDGKTLKAATENAPGGRVNNESDFFKAGLSWALRTAAFAPHVVPAGCIPSVSRYLAIAESIPPETLLGLWNSKVVDALCKLRMERVGHPKFIVGAIKTLPVPNMKKYQSDALSAYAMEGWHLERVLNSGDETSLAFILPNSLLSGNICLELDSARSRLSTLLIEINAVAMDVFDLNLNDLQTLEADIPKEILLDVCDVEEAAPDDQEESGSLFGKTDALISWAIGVVVGRFDLRLATGEREVPPEPAPFDPLPATSPGMLLDGAAPFHGHGGILVDDQGHPHDLPQLIEVVLAHVQADVPGDVRRWLQRDFFPLHLKQYSKIRRKAPIYWPLATSSGSFTLWLYYPSLTSQTLYTAVNDFVEPKLKQVTQQATTLRTKASARTRDEDRTLETLLTLETELIELRDTLLRIAPDYHPNHDDGVQITAAPLWSLFRHKPWQKLLKETWAKLENGDYDWAHLAMAYWPDRVREKCKTDKSLAIAHDLEQLYIEPPAKPAKPRGRKKGAAA